MREGKAKGMWKKVEAKANNQTWAAHWFIREVDVRHMKKKSFQIAC